MAKWNNYTVKGVIQQIEEKKLVLPVVQRNLVWKQEQICELFDTLLRSDSFGGIMTVEDQKDQEPLFAYRKFIKEFTESSQPKSITDPPNQDIQYVVDGQQRLSAFYIGITGIYNHQRLYFNLLSDSKNRKFDFEFAKEKEELPKEMDDAEGNKKEALWESVEDLYNGIIKAGSDEDIFLDNKENLEKHKEKEVIRRNLKAFARQILACNNVGIANVQANRKQDVSKTRNEIVELFRRLNQGGTKLSAMDLMASKLKGFSPENEAFLYDIQFDEHFKKVGFGQDEVLKLIFLLQGDSKKGIADISEKDSDFIQENKEKIKKTIELLSQYPKLQELKIPNIPKYFIAYHLFYKNNPENYFKILDTQNKDFKKMDKWVKISLLNPNIFSNSGAGWQGGNTGIRKILEVMKKHQNKDFPYQEIINVYKKHPLRFQEEINEQSINSMERGFVSNLYVSDPNIKGRANDKDHIHPQSKLSGKYEHWQINDIANFQLLDFSNNRGSKKDKEFYDWINDSNCVNDKETFCENHLIPKNEEFWKSENFLEFLKERKKLLVEKINENLK